MPNSLPPALDLTPPPYSDGLCDWSSTDGTPDSPTFECSETARIARDDEDFGTCLELRLGGTGQRLRYMGEMPLRRGYCIEVRVRIKVLRGPIPAARIAAYAGGYGGVKVPGLPGAAALRQPVAHDAVTELCAVIGRKAEDGVDLVWDARALYAHVGLDLVGQAGGVVRIENFAVRELVRSVPSPLPGFETAGAGASV